MTFKTLTKRVIIIFQMNLGHDSMPIVKLPFIHFSFYNLNQFVINFKAIILTLTFIEINNNNESVKVIVQLKLARIVIN